MTVQRADACIPVGLHSSSHAVDTRALINTSSMCAEIHIIPLAAVSTWIIVLTVLVPCTNLDLSGRRVLKLNSATSSYLVCVIMRESAGNSESSMAPRHASAAPDLVGRGALVVREAPVLGSTAGLGALLAVTFRFKIS